MQEQVKMQLTEKVKQQIDHWVAKFPKEQKISAVLPALHIIQDENDGWLSEELMDAVASYLEIPKIAVYEVATFYSMYDLKPVGKHKINLCTNISCMLRGSEEILEHLRKRLDIDLNQTTKDGKFTLREVECLGACRCAPMMQIDKTYHENLTPEKVDKILNELD